MMVPVRGQTGSLNVLHFLLGVFLVRPEGGCLELIPSVSEVLLQSNTNFTVVSKHLFLSICTCLSMQACSCTCLSLQVCSGSSQVTWQLPGNLLGSRVVVENQGSSSVLRLTDAMWNNSGRYTCQEASSYQNREIDIFIPGPGPEEWFVPQDVGMVAVVDEEGTIPCVVSDPRLNVSLYEQPDRTLVTGTTYTPSLGFTGRLKDTSYLCSASRGNEKKESQEFYTFSVIVPKEVEVNLMVSSSVLKQGETLTLSCSVRDMNMVHFSWESPHRQEVKPWTEELRDGQIRSTIQISRATTADSGLYVCVVQDFLTSKSVKKDVTVTVLGLQAEGQHNWTGARCETTAKADIVLLVGGLQRISASLFTDIKNLFRRIIETFVIGPDRVQIGLVQYSDDIETEWHLNRYAKPGLLKATARLQQAGGGLRTGDALNHILDYIFKPHVGMRADAQKIAVLITDGVSQDDVLRPSQRLKDAGVEVFAIGLHAALESELRSVSSYPDQIHTYCISSFPFLQDLFDNFTIDLCSGANSFEPDGQVRLVGGASRCAGTLEIKREGWRPAYSSKWTLGSAAVVCRELDCGSAASTGMRNESSHRSAWEISFDCVQSGSALWKCVSSGSSSSILEITCSDPTVFIIRLVFLLLSLVFILVICYMCQQGASAGPTAEQQVGLLQPGCFKS
uniref:uncharacterized protein LOC124052745 isoform X2 n=1 Tax=Scatophagus argus TaxID=75038 RepID=UPI001ED813B6|nr:uncharacterized protein LOC124052745 isoform X2 [Scatophagus argus]